MDAASGSPSPVSVAVALDDPAEMSALVSTVRGALRKPPDSIRVSIRGPKSAVIDMLKELDEPSVHVSAALSMRGDAPAAS